MLEQIDVIYTPKDLQELSDILDRMPKDEEYIAEPWGIYHKETNTLLLRPKYEGRFPFKFLEKYNKVDDKYGIIGVKKW